MSASTGMIQAILEAIWTRCDNGSDSARLSFGDPGGDPVELGKGIGKKEPGRSWGNESAMQLLISGFADWIADNMIGGLAPIGTIFLFNGAPGEIPSGWHICDGTSGTPDLTDKFIRGATTAGGSGGSLGFTTDEPTSTIVVQSGSGITVASSVHRHTGTHLPPYYNVIFIMRIS